MRVKCRVERCQRVAEVSADFKFCPYCATRYIEKGIDVPDLVATETAMKSYRTNTIRVVWLSLILLWIGSVFVPLYCDLFDRFFVGYFFDLWIASLFILLAVSVWVVERFFVKPKFKEVYTQPDK